MQGGYYFDIDNTENLEFNSWPHSPHSKILSLVAPNSVVLDVGCSKGYVGVELKKQNCKLFGIEKNPKACSVARNYYKKVIEGDIEKLDLSCFPSKLFDCIICLDILEHLSRPDVVLSRLKQILSPDGKIIVCLPNIARIEHRLQLLFGRFVYTYTGALHKGHLRFFTLKSARDLIKSCGYKIEKMDVTGFGSMIKILPSLFAFQFMFVIRSK